MPSLCVVAGDPSGDAHAARLIEALRPTLPSLTVTGLGGEAMRRAGATLLMDLTATATIGPFDAARHVGAFWRARQLLTDHLRRARPDLAILVDFGDFNLPVIAPLVKRHHIPLVYYISPQVWAWGRWRLRFIRRYVDRMVVFFPFEEAFYRCRGIPVTWVGHPLVESVHPTMTREEALARFGLNPWRTTVGLLPGSRKAEVRRHLPLMLRAARRITWRMPGVQCLLPLAPTITRAWLDGFLASAGLEDLMAEVRIVEGAIADALQVMEVATIASGTATLEAALCEVPMVVVYRTSWPTYLTARLVVRVPRIAIVNVMAGRTVVPELIQHRARPARVVDCAVELLRNDAARERMRRALRQVTERLGPPGAVDRAARVVCEILSTNRSKVKVGSSKSSGP